MTSPSTAAPSKTQLRSAAYTAATSRLRKEYDERFQILMGEECARVGVDFTPRLTPDQRGKQLILTTAQEHGISLADLAAELAKQEADANPLS